MTELAGKPREMAAEQNLAAALFMGDNPAESGGKAEKNSSMENESTRGPEPQANASCGVNVFFVGDEIANGLIVVIMPTDTRKAEEHGEDRDGREVREPRGSQGSQESKKYGETPKGDADCQVQEAPHMQDILDTKNTQDTPDELHELHEKSKTTSFKN